MNKFIEAKVEANRKDKPYRKNLRNIQENRQSTLKPVFRKMREKEVWFD